MADQVVLSIWLRGFTEHNMLGHFEALLEKFPYSRLRPGGVLRIYALEFSEPALLDRVLDPPVAPEEAVSIAREFQHSDCSYQVDTAWDLWDYAEDWRLAPVPASLQCYAPLFPSQWGEQLHVDCGPDYLFLPRPPLPWNPTVIGSNIRSLLHFVEDLRRALPVEKVSLWSESGESLAEQLEQALRQKPG